MPHKSVLALTQQAYIARVAEHHKALKDTRRIDWLEENDYPSFERWSTGWGLTVHDQPTLRAAIDIEMATPSNALRTQREDILPDTPTESLK